MLTGKPCSEESLKDYENTWTEMEECFQYLDEQCKNKKDGGKNHEKN